MNIHDDDMSWHPEFWPFIASHCVSTYNKRNCFIVFIHKWYIKDCVNNSSIINASNSIDHFALCRGVAFLIAFFKTFEWDETDLCFSHRSHTVNTYLTGVERSSVQFSSKVYKCADISWYQGEERGLLNFPKPHQVGRPVSIFKTTSHSQIRPLNVGQASLWSAPDGCCPLTNHSSINEMSCPIFHCSCSWLDPIGKVPTINWSAFPSKIVLQKSCDTF